MGRNLRKVLEPLLDRLAALPFRRVTAHADQEAAGLAAFGWRRRHHLESVVVLPGHIGGDPPHI
jgi:hypothetical protein